MNDCKYRTYLQTQIIAWLAVTTKWVLLFDVPSFAVGTGKKQLFRENIYNNDRHGPYCNIIMLMSGKNVWLHYCGCTWDENWDGRNIRLSYAIQILQTIRLMGRIN